MTAIELKRLSLVRGEKAILSNFDAAIEIGEFIGVFGANGSGKTTLLKAILGLVRPASGEIHVLDKLPAESADKVGYLPQKRTSVADLRLLGWELVASAYRGQSWGLPRLGDAGRHEVTTALETVGALDLAERPLSHLSGGELQRLLLAQALLGQPKLLLLDEPLISLDPRYQQAAVDLVKRIQRKLNITVLFTAHELNPLLGAMNRVLYLGHGQAALGTPDEVITSGVLSKLYDTPIEVLRLGQRIVVVAAHGEVEADAHRHDL